jgi:galactokinase
MTGEELLKHIHSVHAEEIFKFLYGMEEIGDARERYAALIAGMLDFKPVKGGCSITHFPETKENLRVFTSAGRTELGGNHTDHNLGKVLAASIQLDTVAVVAKRKDKLVIFRSTGYPDVVVDLDDLSPKPEEKGSTESLIRGIAKEFELEGTKVEGWTANAASTVLPGSGLSSSASIETLFAKIFDSLYGEGKRTALKLAKMGQKAENAYFGKPSGLMDQIACASGGAVAIDFSDAANPLIKQSPFNPEDFGFALCIVNTHSSHADLTSAYAAIPNEMRSVAGFFNKKNLRSLSLDTLLEKVASLREAVGDRAVLRAIHFFRENERVSAMLETLARISDPDKRHKDPRLFSEYLQLVTMSGDSSWELLQNVSTFENPRDQAVALALALTKDFIGENALGGACRIHGGGFAGTIQAYIPLERVNQYTEKMRTVFGADAVTLLRIRKIGCAELFL